MKALKVAVIGLALSGCDRPNEKQSVSPQAIAETLKTAGDRTLPADYRLTACEGYFASTHKGSDLVPPLRMFIADKEAWAYTPRLAALLTKMGPDASPLRADLLKKQDESPNSQSHRWQECIDAIKE